MPQEPWNDEIYSSDGRSRKSRVEKGSVATRIFTVLAVLFLIIILIITLIAVYLSVGGSTTDSTQEFYNASASTEVSNSDTEVNSSEEVASEDEESESESESEVATTEAEEGSTLTVQAGEGEASIAARAGISIAELERLNPEKMSTGSWLAHPGDIVRIK